MHRDLALAKAEASRILDIIRRPEDAITQQERERIARDTAENFANHINKGFLQYRKSVTESGGFAVTEWMGQGSILRDVLGREFIDMLGGFGLYSYGIRHPRIVEAVKAQLDRSPQYSQEMLDPLRAQLGKDLAAMTPGDIQYGFFATAERAVEGALKLDNFYNTAERFLSTLKGFHRQGPWLAVVMGKAMFREPLLPLLATFALRLWRCRRVEAHLPRPGRGEASRPYRRARAGRGRSRDPHQRLWPRLCELCTRYGVLLIADEVQTGFGRTGAVFGVDHWDVAPDIMCFGKALGGGVVPLSGFMSTPEIWKVMEPNPFMHTTTTGGNPLACASPWRESRSFRRGPARQAKA
jgi:putrescine aminotransferase